MNLCECDCGKEPTPGKRFIHNHHCYGANNHKWKGGRTRSGVYINILLPEHPRATPSGYVYEHILIAERVLGKPLPGGAVIHHHDGYSEAAKKKIVICENHAFHQILHARQRALRGGGHANWRKCKYCHGWDDPTNLYIPSSGKYAMHRRCNAKYHRLRKIKLQGVNHGEHGF